MTVVRVVHFWDDRYGRCYECGNPAAYTSSEHDSWPANLRCSVCAAQDVVSAGATIKWLFTDLDKEEITTDTALLELRDVAKWLEEGLNFPDAAARLVAVADWLAAEHKEDDPS